jgi:Uma2 family endonuclease
MIAQMDTAKMGEPVWELAHLFPYQGYWTEEEYLDLNTNHLIEYSNGFLEVLPMPTMAHQDIVIFLFELLKAFVSSRALGKVYLAPLRVRLARKEYREPDVVFLSAERLKHTTGDYPHGADLVMEVVSGSQKDRERDLVKKREIYAHFGIQEYWIVDPKEWEIIVLRLEGERYAEHGRFGKGEQATSALLPGFSAAVDEVFEAAA